MERPVIRVFSRHGSYIYQCSIVDKTFGKGLYNIKSILYALKTIWLCEKDQHGNYIHAGKTKI